MEKPRAPHAGGARDRADFFHRPGMACGKNPFVLREPLAPRAARCRGRVLFGYFLLHEQEKVTRPPGRRTKTHRDVSRFSRQRAENESKAKQMDSRFRGNDGNKVGTTREALDSRSRE